MTRLESLSRFPIVGSEAHSPTGTRGISIGQYLIRRLGDYGIGHVFGIPGDYILTFYGQLERSKLGVVGCTREDCAGFAADAYARVHGMGAVCVTYCVGGLSVCNSIAGAYAEKSPVVVISGAPGLSERVNNPLLHHKVREFRTQFEVFEKITAACADLSDPTTAFREIDRVLDTVARFKRPGYIELPRDMVDIVPHLSHAYNREEAVSDPDALREATEEAVRLISAAKKPIIIADVEIHRFGLQDKVLALAERARIPIASTLLGKSVIRETHPLYIGLYEGAMGREEITRYVEESDCVLLLGAFMTDLNLGVFTANIDIGRCIYATSEQLRIHHHHYHDVQFPDFLQSLVDRGPTPEIREIPAELREEHVPYELKSEAAITIGRMVARLDEQIDDHTIVVADIGDALFAATELTTHERTEFLSPAYYTSMGFSIPASLGALTARPSARLVAICGDGAFQMTGMELSNIVRRRLAPIVIVLDNHGYGTERILHPGKWEYNEIHPWKYAQLPAVLGGGKGYEIRTEGEFDAALRTAWNDRSQMSLLHVHIDESDNSLPLRRLADRLGRHIT